ncbi:MAG: hypothetical protein CMM00_13470 [Rhodopirellula sp.]|nr:hypothetical protein [Rhodopirellula sp.]
MTCFDCQIRERRARSETRRGGGAEIAEDISGPHDSATFAPPFTPRFKSLNPQAHPSDHLAAAR